MQREGAYYERFSQQEKGPADAFSIGMSLNKEENNYRQRTQNKQAEYGEHLRDREM